MADDAPQKPKDESQDVAHEEAATEGFFTRLMCQFTTAWLFLTRIPLPRWWNRDAQVVETQDATDSGDDEAQAEAQAVREQKVEAAPDKGRGMVPLADTVRAWPIVGLLVGALAGLMLWTGASLGLHPIAASFLGLITAALATGALHEDGLADVADGFGGGADRARKLRIMRDSRIGVYGVLALILATGFKAGSLGGFTGPGLAAMALIVAHATSRAALPMLMVALQPVRRTGLAKGAGTPKREDAAMAALIGVLIAVLTLGLGPGLVAAALAGLSVAAVGWLAQRHIQGLTGDVLGAAQQVAETVVLAGLAAMLQTVFYL